MFRGPRWRRARRAHVGAQDLLRRSAWAPEAEVLSALRGGGEGEGGLMRESGVVEGMTEAEMDDVLMRAGEGTTGRMVVVCAEKMTRQGAARLQGRRG